MDDSRFDALTKALASGRSRRSVLKGLLGLGGSLAAGGTLRGGDARAARRPTRPVTTQVFCPGHLIPDGDKCVCPTGLSKCGSECCNTTSVPQSDPGYTECCDGSCCNGACYGEERCCPTTNRGDASFPLPPSHKFCTTPKGPQCCESGDLCCTVDGCCDTLCYGGTSGRANCCPLDKICAGGNASASVCCTGNQTCCHGGTNANICVDLTVEGHCCTDADCNDSCLVCSDQHICVPKCTGQFFNHCCPNGSCVPDATWCCPNGEPCSGITKCCDGACCIGDCCNDVCCSSAGSCCNDVCCSGPCCDNVCCRQDDYCCGGACTSILEDCCNGVPYDQRTQSCCDGKVVSGRCCVDADCHDSRYICCGNNCITGQEHGCCNGTPYGFGFNCCNGEVQRGQCCQDSQCVSGETCCDTKCVTDCCAGHPVEYGQICCPAGPANGNCCADSDCPASGACRPGVCLQNNCRVADFDCNRGECCAENEVCLQNGTCCLPDDVAACHEKCGTQTNNCGQQVQCRACDPIDGGWSDWSPTPCTCPGEQTRTCTNPPPANGGADCSGPSSQPCCP